MDMFKLVEYLPTVLRIADFVKSKISTGLTFKDIPDLIDNPDIRKIFVLLGGLMFPEVHPELRVSAAFVAAYSPEYVKWVQNAANRLVIPSPILDVDGHYGAKTKAAIKLLQSKYGIIADGWAGDITKARMVTDLAKLDVSTMKTPVPELASK